MAAAALPGAAACSIGLHTAKGATAVAASDATAMKLDRYQCRIGDGPAFCTARTGVIVEVADVSEDLRWPQFARHARDLGVSSTLCVSVPIPGAGLVLTFISPDANSFDDPPREAVIDVVRQALCAAAVATRT
jgi:hypothetical protein